MAAAQGLKGNELPTVSNDIMVAGQPGDRQSAGLGHCHRRGGRSCGGAVDGGGLCWRSRARSVTTSSKGAINPAISEKNELLAARISMAVSILVATILG